MAFPSNEAVIELHALQTLFPRCDQILAGVFEGGAGLLLRCGFRVSDLGFKVYQGLGISDRIGRLRVQGVLWDVNEQGTFRTHSGFDCVIATILKRKDLEL